MLRTGDQMFVMALCKIDKFDVCLGTDCMSV